MEIAMMKFIDDSDKVVLLYEPDYGADWITRNLQQDGEATLSRTFTVRQDRRLDHAEKEDEYDEEFRFVIGHIADGYRHIDADCLDIKHDLLISTDIKLERKMFIGEHNVSIFSKIDELTDSQIIIGGEKEGSMPEQVFRSLLASFPTATVLRRYSQARIGYQIQNFLDLNTPVEHKLNEAIERNKRKIQNVTPSKTSASLALAEFDITKLVYVKDKLIEMLSNEQAYSENDWEKEVADLFLLLYPRYIHVFHQVTIPDTIARGRTQKQRRIDLLLVDADGYIDVIEIKRPHTGTTLRAATYRDNYIPAIELEGTVMQVRKYLHHLTRWGKDGETKLQRQYHHDLPENLKIHITNPRGIVLAGRSEALQEQQALDFEVIRRGYTDIIDIMTYDALLRRLDNMIEMLTKSSDSNNADSD